MPQLLAMANHSIAFRLLCACCRWPLSAAKPEAVLAAAAEGVHRDEFQALTDFHRVYGLVHSALRSVPLEPPQPLSNWLSAKAQAIARTGLLHLSETIRLQRMFAEAGIESVVIKGVGLGHHVYGSVALKHSRDIDIVVAPKNVAKALSLAQNDGYQLTAPAPDLSSSQIAAFTYFGKEFVLAKGSDLLLEIHCRLLDNPGLLNEKLLDPRGQEIVCGSNHRLRTLTDGDLFAYLCAHGANHHWARLKWLADVNALLVRAGNAETVAGFNARSETLGTRWCTVLAQLLCQELFETPLPEPLKSLAATQRIQSLKRYCYRAMTLPDRTGEPEPMRELHDTIALARLGSGWRFWCGFWRVQAVKTTVILELNLPTRLIFLYPYLRPLFWLWFRWLSPRGRYRWRRKAVDTST